MLDPLAEPLVAAKQSTRCSILGSTFLSVSSTTPGIVFVLLIDSPLLPQLLLCAFDRLPVLCRQLVFTHSF
jgi:hypothetical protein